jgi:hypothetical protein
MTEPIQVGELLPGVLQEVIERAGHGYDRWMEQVAATGYCAHPVRLRGRVEHADAATGEVRTVYSTDGEPDATLLKGCGNRRAAVCPSCSATYQADSFHLLAAGLRGGKGVPETVTAHPRLFVTFTAPSFGKVHTRKAQGLLVYPCHPYRQGAICPHGRRAGCWQRHDPDDPRLGEPLCARCYQAGAQVLWNALAGRLWSRTTIYVYRALAQLAGLTEGELRGLVRVSFAKVAEYQRRGVVHFHAIIRLDAATDCGCPACVAPPPNGFTAGLLERAVRQAAGTVAVPCPMVNEDQDVTLTARWGEQLDVRYITEAGDEGELSAEQVAGYVAKYATKATEAVGVTLDHRIGEVELKVWMCRRMWLNSSGPAWSSAPGRRWRACGCPSGRTCLASAATFRPRAAATRPPWGRCGGPGSPTPSAGAAATTYRWTPGARPRTTRRSSWSPPGATSAAATSRPGRRGWLPRRPLGRGKRGGSPRRSYEPPSGQHEPMNQGEQAGWRGC